MDIMEIILLVLGGIVFVLSFIVPDGRDSEGANGKAPTGDEIKRLVNQELESIRSHVDDVVEEAITYAMEKTERSLERLSNEKIMAVSEYSDTVLAEIHKNHEEAMFLYDMLNNKQASLKNTVSEINKTVKEAEEMVSSFQRIVPEQPVFEGKLPQMPLSSAESSVTENAADDSAAMENVVSTQTSGGRNQSRKNGSKRNSSRKNAANRSSSGQGTQGKAYTDSIVSKAKPEQEDGKGQNSDVQPEYNNNEKILGLYKEGKSAVEIAKELELGVGEVSLVIDLFKS